MFFRFAAAIGLLTAIALAAISIEKQNLSLKRQISLQHYRLQLLQEQRARLVLQTQRLGAPPRLMKEWERGAVRLEAAALEPAREPAKKKR
jgi:hypothetical protein